MGPIDATGFDGGNTTASAPATASSTPGAGLASAAPSYRTAFTSSAACRRTQYSWKCRSRGRPMLTASILVVTGSSDIGRIRLASPNRAATRAVASDSVAPDRRSPVRNRWVARSRSPRPNHDPSAPNSRSSSVARNVSARRPHPRSRSMTVPSQYVTESRSGETWRPCNSMSSAVFTTTVTLRGGTARTSPRRNFPAPIPPASATTFTADSLRAGGAGLTPGRAGASADP